MKNKKLIYETLHYLVRVSKPRSLSDEELRDKLKQEINDKLFKIDFELSKKQKA